MALPGCAPDGAVDRTCEQELYDLYNAYSRIIAGAQEQSVQTADFRRMDYTPANLDHLISHYNNLWDLCGAATGLPRLVKPGTNLTRRGGPTRFGCA